MFYLKENDKHMKKENNEISLLVFVLDVRLSGISRC